jgi:HK97 family phage major capsid protein
MNRKEMLEKANGLFVEAKGLLEQEEISAEDAERRDQLLMEAKNWHAKAAELKEIEQAAVEFKAFQEDVKKGAQPGKLKNAGQWLTAVKNFYDPRYRLPIPELGKEFPKDDDEPDMPSWLSKEAQEHKDLLESVGASGGFLVPVEFRPELLGVVYEDNPIRERATVIPMRRRQLTIPTLDQTGTTAGATRQHGGIVASWTEEAKQKAETDPAFRQINLVAHKLVCYTEVSDELLADEAVGLVAFLNGPMGFAGAIRWEEEYTFLQGSAAGQPLGVLNAAATITVNRATAGAIGVVDIFNMLSQHHGDNPCWHISRAAMPQLLALNGPAANPSYIFIPNAREGAPGTLFGFPIYYTEKLPTLGTSGDILLADWNYYIIGDRQATTVDNSMHYRFQYDLTAWRAVHRVDGQPWLSAPLTLADGATQISPFVILGDVAS